jgi:hypothetical protein
MKPRGRPKRAEKKFPTPLKSALAGVQSKTRLDSRLKHAGMTDFEEAIHLMQRSRNTSAFFQQLSKTPSRQTIFCYTLVSRN